ncbi:MAG TPA: hypothetical protein VHA82_22650 [Ramlibacter sp.]|nr:hypothetical protein [Ramlibacter sp.]HVZ46623.1 hypothetical protein [Ramlibacter sp.]
MYSTPPAGVTPPAPGLEKEEPDCLMFEDDIPLDEDSGPEADVLGHNEGA